MKYAIIDDNGIVTNIVVSNRQLEANWIAIPTGCPAGIGDSYLNGCFYDEEGNMRQAPELSAATQRIAELEAQNQVLTEENLALQEQCNMLMECVLEMSELVYA